MTNPEHIHDQQQHQEPFARVSMEPLFERLLKRTFSESVSAIEYCRALCAEFGFTVKQEASANRNIYVYCSREGLPDSQRNPKPSPQRKRPSKRCDCRWRVVLSENEHDQWEFRKSMNPNASEHNHEMMSPDEMVKAWPSEVNDLIIQLARQRLQTHEIRETVKQQFPDITWNERRFYNRLTEERKRIKQRGVLDRSQRLLLLSARLCSIVASNEDWASSVEQEMLRLLESYCQLSRLPPEATRSLTDLQPDMIQAEGPSASSQQRQQQLQQQQQQQQNEENNNNSASPASSADMMITDEASPAKKRKSVSASSGTTSITTAVSRPSDAPKGAQVVYVPSYMLFVRNQPMRSSSEPSSQSIGTPAVRRAFLGSPPDMHHPMGNMFPLASPTSSSSSTSSLSFQQQSGPPHQQTHHHQQQQRHQQQYGNTRRFDQRVSSPSMVHDQQSMLAYSSQPANATPIPAPQGQPHQQQQQQQQYAVAQNLSSYPMAAAAAAAVAGGGPFSPYNMGPQSTTDIQFGFDGGMATAATTPNTAFTANHNHQQQQQQQQEQQQQQQQQQRLERPEPTHPHDAAYQQQQQQQQRSTNNNNNNNSSWSPSVFNPTYPIKEEPMPDQRTMMLREQQQQQRLSRNMSQQGFIPSSMSMMRNDGQQQPSSSNDNSSTTTWT